jgi:hypothetical protein
MNIGFYKRPLMGTLFTTAYFIGILVSASTMRYEIVGATFFVGALAIFFSARNKHEVVVYVEKKKEEEIQQTIIASTQLDDEALKRAAHDPQLILNEICNTLGAGQGAIYINKEDRLDLAYGYALPDVQSSYKIGEGLVGRVASEKSSLYLDKLPEGYITVFSGLGNTSPRRLALIPITSGVIEIATFNDINASTLKHIEESCSEILK